jgi:hypothetical protein
MATQLVQQLTEQATALVREELAAARAEVVDKGRRAGIGAKLVGAAGVLALYGSGALAVTIGALLALVWPVWLAVLVTTGLLLAVAGVAALTGKAQFRKPSPEEAMASGRRDVEAVRDALRRSGG